MGILGGLEVCESHFLVMSSMCLSQCNFSMIIIDLWLCGFHHWCFEGLIVLSVFKLHVSLMYFVCFVHDDRCCSFAYFVEVYGRVVF